MDTWKVATRSWEIQVLTHSHMWLFEVHSFSFGARKAAHECGAIQHGLEDAVWTVQMTNGKSALHSLKQSWKWKATCLQRNMAIQGAMPSSFMIVSESVGHKQSNFHCPSILELERTQNIQRTARWDEAHAQTSILLYKFSSRRGVLLGLNLLKSCIRPQTISHPPCSLEGCAAYHPAGSLLLRVGPAARGPKLRRNPLKFVEFLGWSR